LLAIVTAFIATRAYTPAYAFHMALFSLGSVLAVVAINIRYNARPIAPTRSSSTANQLQLWPIKFTSLAALFWGTAGFAVGLYLALELAFPALNSIFPGSIRAATAVAHFGGDLRLRRQRLAGDVLLCAATHLARAHRRRSRAVVRGAGLQFLHPDRRHRLSARHYAQP